MTFLEILGLVVAAVIVVITVMTLFGFVMDFVDWLESKSRILALIVTLLLSAGTLAAVFRLLYVWRQP